MREQNKLKDAEILKLKSYIDTKKKEEKAADTVVSGQDRSSNR